MNESVPPASLPLRRSRSRFRKLIVFAVLLLGSFWIYKLTHPPPPSIMLPDGTKLIYHSVSRGKPEPPSANGQPEFSHFASNNDNAWRRAWQTLRDHSPAWLSKLLPNRPLQSMFQDETCDHEFELRFLKKGPQGFPKWYFGIADDDGWETQFNEVGWNSGQSTAPGSPSEPDQVWLACPLPRHSRLLRIRFHPWEKSDTPIVNAAEWGALGELIIPNPCYQGPAPASSVTAGPVTKATRFGDVTLSRVERERLVAEPHAGVEMWFDVKKDGKPVELDCDCTSITDRSGQQFRITQSGGDREKDGKRRYWLHVAPWSDDPVWKITMSLQRPDRCTSVEESELFRFEHLPVPQGKLTEVNRSITRNGVTFHIHDIELTEYNDWRFGLEYSLASDVKNHSLPILIHDSRDDQDRTRIAHGPVGGTKKGWGYSLQLAPDARWWNLTVLLETPETVEFEIRPEFIK